uniref:Uncharacterized protein n=1 Tax=Acrobeloides nanus TaxID=290746 RepID=A0A914D9I9_9BILA
MFSEVHFIPYCTNSQCWMWMVPYIYSKYSTVRFENGTIFRTGDQYTNEIYQNGEFINRIYSIGCNGCASLKNLTCTRKAASVYSIPQNTAALTIVGDALSDDLDLLKRPEEAGFAGDRTYKNGVDVVVLESALPIHWTFSL